MTPLIIAFTPNYLVPAATTLKSVLNATAAGGRYEVICLVTEDIPTCQKEKLDRIVGDRMSFKYVNCAGRLNGAYIDPRYSEAASYRLLLPELLPEYNKVAYIDCDVIVRNDIGKLYNETNLDGYLLAAVAEAKIENQGERWEALGCDSRNYFNSGFLLLNLKQMREEGTSAKMLEALHADYLEFPDQDVLNIVCQGRTLLLPPIYNSIRTFFILHYKPDFLQRYSEEEWDAVQNHGTIHYTGGKPWNIFSVRFNDWWKCYESLPNEIKEEWKVNRKMELLYRVNNTWLGGGLIRLIQSVYRSIHSLLVDKNQN